MSGQGGDRVACGDDRQRIAENVGSVVRRRIGGRYRDSKHGGSGIEDSAVAPYVKRRQGLFSASQPSGERDVGTDAGGFAERHGEG